MIEFASYAMATTVHTTSATNVRWIVGPEAVPHELRSYLSSYDGNLIVMAKSFVMVIRNVA
jgi:hypothetical protein